MSKTKLEGKSIYDGPKKKKGLKKQTVNIEPKKRVKLY